jgi:hypothetical protein
MYAPWNIARELVWLMELYTHPHEQEVLQESFRELLKHLPDAYWSPAQPTADETGPTIPLHDALDDIGHAIMDFAFPIWKAGEDGHFEGIRQKLEANECSMNGLTPYQRRRTSIPDPWERDEPPDKRCWLYFHDTPLLDVINVYIPFRIPRKTWASHGIVLAPSGHGKTQLLGSLITGFLSDSDNRIGCFVLDPHGDLFNNLAERVSAERLVLLDPDTKPPPLNFLDFGNSTEAQTLQTFSYLMSSLSGGLSDKQGAIVPYLLKLLKRIPAASLETLRQLVDEKVKTAEKSEFYPYISQLDKVDQGFFHNQFYSSRMQETKDAIGWKLYAALSSDAFRQMFGAKQNSVNFDRLIAERKVVVIKGGFDALGEEGMRVFLQFLVAQYYAAGMRRLRLPERERHLNLFICDEASHILTTPIVARMLFDLRKVACGFLAATQVWEQVATDVKAAVLGNTAIKIVGPVQHNDASVLSREMYCDINFIRNMQRSDNAPYAPWAVYVNGMTKKAARVTVPFGVLERMPKINQDAISVYDYGQFDEEEEPENPFDYLDDHDEYLAETHEAPEKGASRSMHSVPAKADTTTLPQSTDEISDHEPMRKA